MSRQALDKNTQNPFNPACDINKPTHKQLRNYKGRQTLTITLLLCLKCGLEGLSRTPQYQNKLNNNKKE